MSHADKDCDYCEAVLKPSGRQLCQVCRYGEMVDISEVELMELIDDD